MDDSKRPLESSQDGVEDKIQMDLSVQEVTDFFEAVGARLQCEICSNESWHVGAETTNSTIPVLLAAPKDAQILNGYVFPLVIVNCRRCGNVRQFWRPTIMDWKASRASEGGGHD